MVCLFTLLKGIDLIQRVTYKKKFYLHVLVLPNSEGEFFSTFQKHY